MLGMEVWRCPDKESELPVKQETHAHAWNFITFTSNAIGELFVYKLGKLKRRVENTRNIVKDEYMEPAVN